LIKEQLKSLFSFSKKELNGLLVFAILLTGIVFLPDLHLWFFPPKTYSFEAFEKEITAFKTSMPKNRTYSYKQLRNEIEEKELEPEYFPFNPNGLSETDWKKLGLSAKQIRVIKNYESKGGKFYRKADLQKIYSISAEDYQRLLPYIMLPDKQNYKNSSFNSSVKQDFKKREAAMVDLNTADSAALEMLPGIGPAFASRILKYRNKLGGFHAKEQLLEVYGMDSARYYNLEKQLLVNANAIKKLNINTAEFADLRPFPYLTFKQMNAIIQYRRQHGNFKNIDDMKRVAILNEEILRKIAPYLSF